MPPAHPPRATPRFLADPVPAEHVAAMIEAARWTGSARNRQPWRFVVVRDAVLRAELSRLGAYAQHLAGAPLVVGLAVDESSGADAHFDMGRAAQVLMSAAADLGYGTCPATLFPDSNVAAAGCLVGMEPPWMIRWALSVGRPAPAPDGAAGVRAIPSGRRSAEVLVREF
jgi:nitroreductase